MEDEEIDLDVLREHYEAQDRFVSLKQVEIKSNKIIEEDTTGATFEKLVDLLREEVASESVELNIKFRKLLRKRKVLQKFEAALKKQKKNDTPNSE